MPLASSSELTRGHALKLPTFTLESAYGTKCSKLSIDSGIRMSSRATSYR